MKRTGLLLAGCLWVLAGAAGKVEAMPLHGAEVEVAADSSLYEPIGWIEDMPKFLKGNMTKWIAKNTKYPKAALERKAEGKVFVQFVIEKDGRVTNVRVLRPVDPDLDREAVRVVSSMPRWQPGKQRGKFVRVPYTVPINFRLKNGRGGATAEPDVDAYVLTGNGVHLPLFPGNWDKWIKERIREEGFCYSEKEGVTVGFIVEADGRIKVSRMKAGADGDVAKAARDIVANMPDWVPGTVNGTPVRMRYAVRVPMEDSVYMAVDEEPEFPEGDAAEWILRRIRNVYSNSSIGHGVEVKFVIEKDGRITNAKVCFAGKRQAEPELDREAVRLVESMPRWIPGKRDGKPVRVSYGVTASYFGGL